MRQHQQNLSVLQQIAIFYVALRKEPDAPSPHQGEPATLARNKE
ncbi:hypothetical protein [Erwinia sp. V71]